MLESLKCGCEINIESLERIIWCPICGKYQIDVFLGEPFPPDFDSPFREMLKGLFLQKLPTYPRIAGNFWELKGTETWPMIANAIKNSDICFFDMTGEIFNVGFEMGYALSQWSYTGFKKYIIVGSSESPSNHVLRNMNILKILPQNRNIAEIIKHYFSDGDFRKASENWTLVDEIKKCQKEIFTYLFDIDIEAEIKKLYGTVNYPAKSREKDVLILTTETYENFFRIDDYDKLSIEFMFPDSLNSLFLNTSGMRFILQRICREIIKNYDYLIVHLQGEEFDEARRFNFESAIVAGMMRGFKGEERMVDFYLSHEKNTKPFLRCSDVEPIARYGEPEKIGNIIKNIFHDILTS